MPEPLKPCTVNPPFDHDEQKVLIINTRTGETMRRFAPDAREIVEGSGGLWAFPAGLAIAPRSASLGATAPPPAAPNVTPEPPVPGIRPVGTPLPTKCSP